VRRVLHVSHTALPGGHNEVLLSLLRHAPDGVTCDCVYLEPGPMVERAAALGARVAVVDAGRAREAWKAPRVVRALRGAIRRTDADVVMAHVTKAHLYAWAAAGLEQRAYLWRQPERRGQKPLLHEVSGRLKSGVVICSSEITAADQRRWRTTPVRCVHPGCEIDDLGAAHEHAAREALVAGVVGRLQRWKRVELALRAWPAVLAELPRARLRIVGGAAPGLDQGYPEELQAEAERLGIAHAVEFAGHLSSGAGAIADLDLLIHCAEREPFGLVLVEALLRGVPPVAANEGGPTEIVRDGVDGVLLDVERAADLAAAVVALGADPRRRATMGAAGRERALADFTAARMAADIWTIVGAGARDGQLGSGVESR
jgi:glycosyltransferase involved in cell wall biosynthesis